MEVSDGENPNHFFDISGTVLNPRTKQISDKTVEALKALNHKGIKLCATTRLSSFNIPALSDVKFDASITFDGKFCYAENKLIFSQEKMIQIDKKVAIDKILDYFHIEKNEALAFASGDNDIELFCPNVGYTVAMGNASNRLKLDSNEICGSIDEDGLYHFLETYFII